MTAAAVHRVPGVEVARPALHLLRGDLGWIVHHAREDARLVNARGPQLLREPVIGADLPGQLVQHRRRNAVRLLHMHAEARHRRAHLWISLGFQLQQDRRRGGSTLRHNVEVMLRTGTSVHWAGFQKSFSESRRMVTRSEEHTSELQSLAYLVCRLLLEKKKTTKKIITCV